MPWISAITRYPHCWTQVLCFALCSLMTSQGIAAEPPNTAHPLDPLSKEEITATVAALKASGKVSDSSRFPHYRAARTTQRRSPKLHAGGAQRAGKRLRSSTNAPAIRHPRPLLTSTTRASSRGK